MIRRIEILDGDIVVNTVRASAEQAQQIYPGAWREAAEQDDAMPEPTFTRLTKLGFRSRFTQAEKTVIELASLDDPSASMQQRAKAADVRVYLADVASATYIDPQRPDTRAGVLALEAEGLISGGRALEILDVPIQAGEAYLGQG